MTTGTYVFRVEGMHCANCSLLIDDTLEDLPGVSRSHTEFKTGRCAVELDTSHTDPRQIIDTITGLGYNVSVQP